MGLPGLEGGSRPHLSRPAEQLLRLLVLRLRRAHRPQPQQPVPSQHAALAKRPRRDAQRGLSVLRGLRELALHVQQQRGLVVQLANLGAAAAHTHTHR